ncbi:hypothetical protein LPUS_04613 [Lasallia pustulata]|uniref:Reverse transcriptase RNase H-like domain-containing protein n=1 Tax=Lasallia pustulata TaxID=136370 RepID=A0A1W5CX06_9LECA|nr:hypothetical protein LPUS_04613 [Lasallia pustulata]
MAKQLGLHLYSLSDVGFAGLTMKTADHRETLLHHWVYLDLGVEDIWRQICCFVAPELPFPVPGMEHLSLLLGIPWLYSVNATIGIWGSRIEIGDPAAGETIRDIVEPELVFSKDHNLLMYPRAILTARDSPSSSEQVEELETDSAESLSEEEEEEEEPPKEKGKAKKGFRYPSHAELQTWAAELKIQLGNQIPSEADELQVLQLLYSYRHLNGTNLDSLPSTDLIHANGELSAWNARAVIIDKEENPKPTDEPRITFDYSRVKEDMPRSYLELMSKVHNYLSDPRHGTFFQADIKHGYFSIVLHLEDCYLFAFTIPGIGQLRPTRMPQGSRSARFIMSELMNITLGPIPEPNSELSLMHGEPLEPAPIAFYIDDLFSGHPDFESQFAFLCDHFFPQIEWAKLTLSFQKFRLFVDHIKALRVKRHIGRRIHVLDLRVEAIAKWPEPTSVKGFQKGDKDSKLVEVPIIYDALTFSATERKYQTYKRELCAIAKFASKFQYLLWNLERPGIIHTDHKPLVHFLNSSLHDGIYGHWAVRLWELHVKIVDIKGTQNVIADGLSQTIFFREDCGEDNTVYAAQEHIKEEGA